MLFHISETAFKANRDKCKSILNELTKNPKSGVNNHSKLFNKIFEIEVKGNITRKQKYAPLYAKIEYVILTATNYSERHQCYLSYSIPNRNTKLMTRYSILFSYISPNL